jgi:hypothetical protein
VRKYTRVMQFEDKLNHAVSGGSSMLWAACEGLMTPNQRFRFDPADGRPVPDGAVTCLQCVAMLEASERAIADD